MKFPLVAACFAVAAGLALASCAYLPPHFAAQGSQPQSSASGATVTVEPGPATQLGSDHVMNRIHVLDVRMQIRNPSNVSWVIDPKSQSIRVDGDLTAVQPSYMSVAGAPAGTPAVLTVAPGGRLVVDYLYPVPKTPSPDKLYDFVFEWKLHPSLPAGGNVPGQPPSDLASSALFTRVPRG